MRTISRFVGISGLLLCALSAQQPAPKKRALVMGSGDYQALPKVSASLANVEAVKAQLAADGFDLVFKINPLQRDLVEGISSFTGSVNAGDIVFFYYSGYGMQYQGEDYLLPVDYKTADNRAPSVKAYSVGRLLDTLELRKAGTRIVVLDSAWDCAPLGEAQGLAQMQVPGSLILFNAASGTTIKPPAGNSPDRFTSALVDALTKQGSRLLDVFNDVQKNGMQPGESQGPFLSSAGIENFYFIEPKPVPTKEIIVIKPPEPGEPKQNLKDRLNYVWIPSGTFRMGCVEADTKCKADEKPAHVVSISKGFWLTSTEITRKAYQVFTDNTKHKPPPKTKQDYGGHATDVPVSYVTWQDAQDYCQWAGGGLPTEAQWEYAARAGVVGQIYPWGNESDRTRANFLMLTNRQGMKKTFPEATPVGSYPETGWHLLDMAGNVSEWVVDVYNPKAYEAYLGAGPAVDPVEKSTGKEHVVRGGSWYGRETDLRVSARDRMDATKKDGYIGFRCVVPDLH